jgi:signal transduction histidine kinase
MHLLRGYALAEELSEPGFDGVVDLTAQYLDAPVAMFSVIDASRVWCKSRLGVDVAGMHREMSFCEVCAGQDRTLIVEDARLDRRFARNGLVTGEPYIRFYAGTPLHAHGGQVLGTLCVLDTRAREFSPRDKQVLQGFAAEIEARLELRRLMLEQRDLFAERAALTNMIVHDAKGVLTALRWNFGMLAKSIATESAVLDHCSQAVDQLQHMCNSIANMHEGDSREILVECRPANLRVWMEFLGRRLAVLARDARMTLLVESRLPDEPANTDTALLERIVVNLTRNAIRACDPGASLLIEASLHESDRLELIVSDDGPGVPDATDERIFDPYFTTIPEQAPGPVSELAFCRLAARALNGTFECRPREPTGAEFVVEVPVD